MAERGKGNRRYSRIKNPIIDPYCQYKGRSHAAESVEQPKVSSLPRRPRRFALIGGRAGEALH